VCYLNSYANPIHEIRTGEILRDLLDGTYISISAEVLPQMREYERTSTTVVNAYVGPPVRKYIQSMTHQMTQAGLVNSRLMVMQSSGGILDSNSVIEKPAQIIECGPAAGVIGAQFMSTLTGYDNLITLDMGGTTAKASLIEKGQLSYAEEYEVGGEMSTKSALGGGGGYALKLPVLDISEVGAGGGSIAWLDKANSLKIGPQSAGAVPGPACYGSGNDHPTVTDANVVLGYLNSESLAGNSVPILQELAQIAIQKHIANPLALNVVESAYGIHQVANANMMRAVKAVTTLRGRDPRDFSMLAFGGSGGVHAVELARSLQIRKIVLPLAAGVYSALGLLWSNLEVNETLPFLHLASDFSTDEAEQKFLELKRNISQTIGGAVNEIHFQNKVDARFLGQAFELTTDYPTEHGALSIRSALSSRFEEQHFLRYGHAFSGEYPVELVNLRVIGTRRPRNQRPPKFEATETTIPPASRNAYFGPAIGHLATTVIDRNQLTDKPILGPVIVEEYEGTAVIPPGCSASIDQYGNVIIEINT
jgi:N-methylhydantoinase A